MKALTYHGSKDVRVETVPDPRLLEDDDIILRVTATAICGSDLHIYRGKIPMMKNGDILGHEFMGDRRGGRPRRSPRVKRGRPRRRAVHHLVRRLLLLQQVAVRGLRDHQSRTRRHPEQEETRAGRGTVRLQPPLRRLSGRAGRVRARAQGQRRAASRFRRRCATSRCCSCPTSCPPATRRCVNAQGRAGFDGRDLRRRPGRADGGGLRRLLGAERIFMVDHHAYRLAFASRNLRRRADQLRRGRRPGRAHHRSARRPRRRRVDRRGRLRSQGQHRSRRC